MAAILSRPQGVKIWKYWKRLKTTFKLASAQEADNWNIYAIKTLHKQSKSSETS